MKAKLRKIGNSLGVLIPKKLLDKLGLSEGDMIDVIFNQLMDKIKRTLNPPFKK